MKIYFVRHGQTNSNKERRHQFPETPLSDHGLTQADAVANRFKHIPIDLILSSPYTRALQTAKAIEKVTSAQLIQSELLIERKHPTIVRGRLMSDPDIVVLHKVLRENFGNKDWHHSDEENFYDLLGRASDAFEFITHQNKENIVVVTHGYLLVLFIAMIVLGDQVTPSLFRSFKDHSEYTNTGLTMSEYKDGKWTLLTLNDYAHLG